MKRILLMVFVSVFAGALFASSLLVKTNGNKLEVIIEKMTDSRIFYKLSTDAFGKTYSVKKESVAVVISSNGKLMVYSNDVEVVTKILNDYNSSINEENKSDTATRVKDSVLTNEGKVIDKTVADEGNVESKLGRMNVSGTGLNETQPIIRRIGGGMYDIDGKIVGLDGYLNCLQANYPNAYHNFESGRSRVNKGWTTFILSSVAMTGGYAYMLAQYTDDLAGGKAVFDDNADDYKVGATFVVLGAIANIISIPVIITGYCKKGRTYGMYMQERGSVASVNKLKIVPYIGVNQIGVAINF